MNVIYIDDDEANRAVLRDMAATAGVTISEAPDARSGLEKISRGKFQLVLMDLRMPEMSGLTAIRQLRADAGSRDEHRVVVVTADLTPGVRDLCTSAGADDFLEKPVSLPKLMEIVASTMMRQPGFLVV